MKKINTKSGFTMIELLVVIGMLLMVVGVGLFFDFSSLKMNYFHSDRDVLISALQHSRAEAVSNICQGSTCTDGRSHGVAIKPADHPDNYVIFQTKATGPETYANREDTADILLDASKDTTTGGDITEVVFSQLSGDVANPGFITLTDSTGRTSTITINSEGQITWTN